MTYCETFAAPLKNWTGNCGDIGYQCLQQRLCISLSGKARTLSGPELEKLRSASFLRGDGEVSHEHALQWIRKNLHSWTIEFLDQLVMNSACESSGKALGQRGSLSFFIEQHIAMMDTRPRIFSRQKGCADLYAFGSKGKSNDDSTGIGDTSGGHYGCRNGIYDLRRERKCSSK